MTSEERKVRLVIDEQQAMVERQVRHRSSLSQRQARWVLGALGFRARPKTRLPYVMDLLGSMLWGAWWVTVKLMSWLPQPGFLGWWPTLPCLALVALGGLVGWRARCDQRVANRWLVEQGHDDVGPRLEALVSGGPGLARFQGVVSYGFMPCGVEACTSNAARQRTCNERSWWWQLECSEVATE